jgi:hypothetical protein
MDTDLLKQDWWHDELAIVLLTVAFYIILIWTFSCSGIKGNENMFDYLRFFTTFYVPALVAFAGKRYADKIKFLRRK